jgi:hypothetical protein
VRPLRRPRAGLLTITVVLAAASSCSGGEPEEAQRSAPAPPAASPGPTAPTSSPSDAVLEQYADFWQALPRASRLPAGDREELLRRYLVDEAYASTVRSLASQENFGHELYGENMPRPEVEFLDDSTARVEDCQDSSSAGVRDADTQEPLTVGVDRNPVQSEMRRGDDGVWRLATIEYTGETC